MKDKNDGWRKHNELIRHRAASGHPAALPDVSPLTKAAQIFAALPQTGAKQRRHQRPTDPHTLFLKRAARIKPGEEDTFIDKQIESFRYRVTRALQNRGGQPVAGLRPSFSGRPGLVGVFP